MRKSTSLRQELKYYALLLAALVATGWPTNNRALSKEPTKDLEAVSDVEEGIQDREAAESSQSILELDYNQKDKKYYLKLEPRVYNTDLSTEAYGGVARLGTVIKGSNSTTVIEVGPQRLQYRSEEIRSIDAAIESYWDVSRGLEAYGRWYPSYVDGYGKVDFYNTLAAGVVVRLNGGIVDVNKYTGLASLTKGQYIKIEQNLSTFGNFQWSGNTSSARLGWASRGKRWTLAVEVGAAYANDLFKGERIRPSALLDYYYSISRNTSLNLSYFPNTDAGFDGPIRGQLGIALIQRF